MRADLAEVYNVDLNVLWAERRWPHLLTLIEQLPNSSRTRQAYFTDDENARTLAEAQLEAATGETVWRPSWRDWSLQAQQMADLIDAVKILQGQLAGKTMKLRPYPRPETSGDRLRETLRRERANNFLKKIVPHAYA